jgi:hypothetical protein
MALCSSPSDLFSFMKASPKALACFLANRQTLMRQHTNALAARFDGRILPSALLAARLRHRRHRSPASPSTREAKKKTRRMIIFYLLHRDANLSALLPTRLSGLCALSTVLAEAEWVISNYAPEAWANMQHEDPFRWAERRAQRSALELSVTERRKFHNALFLYESYCQAFFHNEEILFEEDEGLRRFFFDEYGGNVDVRDFYSIVYFVFDQHWSTLHNVTANLGPAATSSYNNSNTNESVEANAIRNRHGFYSSAVAQSELQLCRFRYRAQRDMHKYVHYLTSQGLGTLCALHWMSLEDQTRFTLASFFTVSLSQYPTVFMVNGIEGFGKGIMGDDQWMPWVNCEFVSYKMAEGWPCASSFWDEHRIDRRWALNGTLETWF